MKKIIKIIINRFYKFKLNLIKKYKLSKIYKSKLLPLEEAYNFHDFISPSLNDPDFDAKPMILFVKNLKFMH